jgi:hypothetical protein
MKSQLILAVILIVPLLSMGQINLKRLTNEYCDCYKKLNHFPESKADKTLKKCFSEKNKLFTQEELTRLFSTAQNQIVFIKLLGGNCEQIIEHSTKTSLNADSISDKEYTANIYRILAYISTSIELEKFSKRVNVAPGEIGIHYNIFLNKITTNSFYKDGLHIHLPHDSLISYTIRQKEATLNLSVLSKYGEEIKLNISCWYSSKPDSVVKIHKKIGRRYKSSVVIPSIRSSISIVLSNYSFKDLSQLGKDELSDLIESEVIKMKGVLQFFNINTVIVDEIEFPEIISQAKAANLLATYESLNSKNYKTRLSALNQFLLTLQKRLT